MFYKKEKLVVILTVVALFLFSSVTASAAEGTPAVKRLSGNNRYATSAAVALSRWTQSNYAILAYGNDFPDALSAAPLAKKYNAPILLTESNSIPKETLDALQQLKVNHIIIVGGTGIISSAVEQELTSLGIEVARIFGQDRYETGIKIAEQLDDTNEIVIVTGESFSDALSISPIAVKKNIPIILVRHNEIPAVVKNYINNHKINKTYVIGSGTSLNNTVLTGLSNIELITGNDKYDINLNIIDKFKSDLNLNTVYLATGENFADALSGSILAGSDSNPLIIVGSDISAAKKYLSSVLSTISNVNVLGGAGAIPDGTISKLFGVTSSTVPSAVAQIKFLSDDITKTGTNTATFQYELLDGSGSDITSSVPESQITAAADLNSSISLDSSTGTGTITFKSSTDMDKPVIITLIDKVSGIAATSDKGSSESASAGYNSPSQIADIKFPSNSLTKVDANTVTFKYTIISKNGTDITSTTKASQLAANSTLGSSITLDPSTGTGTIICNSYDNSKPAIVALYDELGVAIGMLRTGDIPVNNIYYKVGMISLLSNDDKLTNVGANTATFKYQVFGRNGSTDITATVPASDIVAAAWVGPWNGASKAGVKLDPSTGTGTITYNFSSSDKKAIITLVYKSGLGVISPLYLGDSPQEEDSVVKEIKMVSPKLTNTGANTATFQYEVLNKYGIDITKKIPASQINVDASLNSTIALDPLTGTGIITYNSAADIDKPITIKFTDKLSGTAGSFTISTTSTSDEEVKITSISINPLKISVDARGIGYAVYHVYDQHGNDISGSELAGVTFKCDAATITTDHGLLIITPNSGVNLINYTKLLITGSDSATGISTNAELTIQH